MKIVCASSMPFAREAFATLGDVVMLEGRNIAASDVKDADLLAIRSTTRIDRKLLEGSRVKFVGTATIGTDHMDTAYMDSHGIRWCSAPGCNATSVSEYVTAALLHLAESEGLTLRGKTIGIIGVGNVGGRVIMKSRALGLKVLANDPPRRRCEGDRISVRTDGGVLETPLKFAPIEQLLEEADILTLHVPLTDEGSDRTRHMADERFFDRLKPGCIFINSARGAVVDTGSLLRAIKGGKVAHAVIDTWENEPQYSAELLALADLGTPHIAGYSFDGKVKGTEMVYAEACRFLRRDPVWKSAEMSGGLKAEELSIDAAGAGVQGVLNSLVRGAYDISADDRRMRETLSEDAVTRAEGFDRLRKEYPVRREFASMQINLYNASAALRAGIRRLGFKP